MVGIHLIATATSTITDFLVEVRSDIAEGRTLQTRGVTKTDAELSEFLRTNGGVQSVQCRHAKPDSPTLQHGHRETQRPQRCITHDMRAGCRHRTVGAARKLSGAFHTTGRLHIDMQSLIVTVWGRTERQASIHLTSGQPCPRHMLAHKGQRQRSTMGLLGHRHLWTMGEQLHQRNKEH